MANENEPAKLLLPYLQRADELQKHEPLVAYYCKLFNISLSLYNFKSLLWSMIISKPSILQLFVLCDLSFLTRPFWILIHQADCMRWNEGWRFLRTNEQRPPTLSSFPWWNNSRRSFFTYLFSNPFLGFLFTLFSLWYRYVCINLFFFFFNVPVLELII